MFYAGDKQLWIKSAYALKARLYNRLANKDPQRYANKALDAIQKSFTSSSEDMIFTKFINSTQNSNPLSAYQLVQPLSSMRFTNISPNDKIKIVTQDDFKVIDGDPRFDRRFAEFNAAEMAEEWIKHTYQNGFSLPDMPK